MGFCAVPGAIPVQPLWYCSICIGGRVPVMMHPKGSWNGFLRCSRGYSCSTSPGLFLVSWGLGSCDDAPQGIVEWVSALFPGLFLFNLSVIVPFVLGGWVPVMMHPKGSWNRFLQCTRGNSCTTPPGLFHLSWGLGSCDDASQGIVEWVSALFPGLFLYNSSGVVPFVLKVEFKC